MVKTKHILHPKNEISLIVHLGMCPYDVVIFNYIIFFRLYTTVMKINFVIMIIIIIFQRQKIAMQRIPV